MTGGSTIEIKQVEAFSKLDFILPDGQLSSRIEARRGSSGIGLVTFYDFPKGKISYRARVFTGFGPWTTGVSGFDQVEFERILQARKFIGRERGVAWDLGRDLGRRYRTTLTLSNQENRLIELSDPGVPEEEGQDRSRQNTASLSLVKDEFRSDDPEVGGYRYEFRTTQGVRQFGGDFEYNKVEFSDEHRFRIGWVRDVFSLRAGAPAYRFLYPVFERFLLGGWDSMRGYPVNHFEGEKMTWVREEWLIPVFSFAGRWWIFAPKGAGLLASIEAGRAGDVDRDFFLSRRYALSACGGITFKWAFRDKVPIALTLAWGKALEKRRGVFYFRYRIR